MGLAVCGPLRTSLLLVVSLAVCTARTFRFAFALDGQLGDFGWAFHLNVARISLQNWLTERHPDINTSHEFARIPTSWNEYCHPQFEAWCKAGVQLLIAEGGQQFCFARLANLYPNTTFISTAATLSGPPNFAKAWARTYQPLYLAGYTAGLMTTSKKVCVSTPFAVPAVFMDIWGFSLGVRNADPTVEIHTFRTGLIRAPLVEVWIVNQSKALGCDVVWLQSLVIDGAMRASELGLLSIGHFTDARLTVGESVITSVVMDLSPVFLRAAEAVLNGTFASEKQKTDWWVGWGWGAMHLGDFSFLVPKDIQTKVLAQVPMLDHIFCGRVCTQVECLCNATSCCLTDAQLYSLSSYPDFLQDHGVVRLPGQACGPGQLASWHLSNFTLECSDCPAGTYAYNVDQTSECRPCPLATFSERGATSCTACPAGTYSDQPGAGQCTWCPAGSIAPNTASSSCSVCSSDLSNSVRTQCDTPPLLWLAGVCGGVAGFLLLVGLCLLWLVRKHGKRNNRAAPKDPSQPFCIIFTDIQGSTSLWAAIPDVMTVALDAHHMLIRRLISDHKCYEVKTIGDSFMCATKCPAQALEFALALQEEFVKHDWGTDRIDKAYADLTCPEITTPGCWNGLRVRVGIHYSNGSVKLDPVSKGYDYYGTVVNTAARIESVCHGGQIGVSEAIFQALGGHHPRSVWANLGPQALRGLVEPLCLYQVLPEGALSRRLFPPLRIDREDDKEDALADAKQHAAAASLLSHVHYQPSVVSTVASHYGATERWAETHPLVTRGSIGAEDLRQFYCALEVALVTLLTPLARTMKQELTRELCTLFHVPNHGSTTAQLPDTLDGLVKRVLPTTVLQQAERRESLLIPVSPKAVAALHRDSSFRSKTSSLSVDLGPLSSRTRLLSPRTASAMLAQTPAVHNSVGVT